MAKSKGNFYSPQDITKKGFDPMHLRLLYLSSHCRKPLDFSWKAMKQAKANFERIAEWVRKLKEISGNLTSDVGDFLTSDVRKRFDSAMNDDLNTPLALSVLYDLITETNKKIKDLSALPRRQAGDEAGKILATFEKMNKVFGLKFPEKETKIPENIKKMATIRAKARIEKKFKESDRVRKEIKSKGYIIEDLEDGYKIKKL